MASGLRILVPVKRVIDYAVSFCSFVLSVFGERVTSGRKSTTDMLEGSTLTSSFQCYRVKHDSCCQILTFKKLDQTPYQQGPDRRRNLRR